jgi:hypothetical protein
MDEVWQFLLHEHLFLHGNFLKFFFLSFFKEKLLTYLQEVSDRIDREEENSAVLQAGLPIKNPPKKPTQKTHPKKTTQKTNPKNPPKKTLLKMFFWGLKKNLFKEYNTNFSL